MIRETTSESATAITLLRLQFKMDRQAFAEYFNIPYRTVQNWELGYRKCPSYLREIMRFKLTHDPTLEENKHFYV